MALLHIACFTAVSHYNVTVLIGEAGAINVYVSTFRLDRLQLLFKSRRN